MVKSKGQSYFVPITSLKVKIVTSSEKVRFITFVKCGKVVMSWIRQRPTRTNHMKCFVLMKATLTLEYLFVKKWLLTRESYMSRSQWES